MERITNLKRCKICSNLCDSKLQRCNMCGALLPTESILTMEKSPIKTVKKKCTCGYLNNPHAVICKKCNKDLSSDSFQLCEITMNSNFHVQAIVSTGEEFEVTRETIIGRDYQDKIWDCYVSRKHYRIEKNGDTYYLVDIKHSKKKILSLNKSYPIGLKTIKFIEEWKK